MIGITTSDPVLGMRSAGVAGISGRCIAIPTPSYRPLLQGVRRRCKGPERARGMHTCSAASQGSGTPVYKGVYGDWTLEQTDVDEVTGYRAGLTIAAGALLLDTALSLSGGAGLSPEVLRAAENAVAVVGTAGFGVSLYLIHIYVTPLKRFLQLLWGTGSLGALALMITQPESITQHVASNPGAVWAVGPFFAALTGVAFKEGVCYGKPECAALFFMTPALLLGHLSGVVPEAAEKALLLAFVATCAVFAARKYTQAVKDDIGDKSVFMFQALPEEEQAKVVSEMERARWTD